MGQRGAVATSQPLATLAGMEMLWAGGNAVDAAVAMAIALTVVEPTSNGIGGDLFALVWDGRMHGLNASGKSPAAMTLDQYKGLTTVPERGWLSVTVPGAVSGWRALWERWGSLPFEQLFEPAIRYAQEGYPVSPETSIYWQRAESVYLPLIQPEFQPFRNLFFPKGRAPLPGEVWASLAHAVTLKTIAATGGESLYRGALAQQLATFSAATGGLLTLADLANHQPRWVDPISTTYRDVTVWELPPNTQGIVTLMGLNILEGIDLGAHPRESEQSYHYQIEAMKLALADGLAHVSDPDFMVCQVLDLLDKTYAEQRRSQIQEQAISLAQPGLLPGGTVYLAAADQDLTVSLIQSNFNGFGSGIAVPETGIALHDRACGFTLNQGHPNQLGPNKHPFHTIIPGFLSRNGHPWGAFGVMGGAMQAQGHLQMVVNLVDYGLNPQAALDAPRWRFSEANRVFLEPTVAPEIAAALQQRQHQIRRGGFLGRGQIILKQNGVLIAGSEPRADGLAIAW